MKEESEAELAGKDNRIQAMVDLHRKEIAKIESKLAEMVRSNLVERKLMR